MLDSSISRAIKPAVDAAAQRLARAGLGANALTVAGFAIGMAAMLAITQQAYLWGLAGIALSRVFDALDGAVARQTAATDRGGFLDISLDFLFYASIPLAFAIAEPGRNALAAAALLAGFVGTASTFLAFAALAAKRGLGTTAAFPNKSLAFLGGLTEATETLAVFAAMCIWPQHFASLAYGFAAACMVTIAMRLWWGWRALAD